MYVFSVLTIIVYIESDECMRDDIHEREELGKGCTHVRGLSGTLCFEQECVATARREFVYISQYAKLC